MGNAKEDREVKKLLDQMVNKFSSYRGNPLLKKAREEVVMSVDHIEEYKKCKNDPVYFANNYIKIVHVDKGLINIEVYEYQKRILQGLKDNRYSAILSCRQSGKSTILVCFILWYILFHRDKACAIIANKGRTAQQIMARLQLAYIHLPKWIQQGIADGGWNKQSIFLENGSSVISAATSSDSIRGGSFSLVFVDECAFIPKNVWTEFYKSTFPTISSGQDTKFIVVSTPCGQNHFYDIWTKAVAGKSKFTPLEVNWWDVPGRDEEWKKEQLMNMTEEEFQQEYGNSFLGSTNTLIPVYTLKIMENFIKEPVQQTKSIRIYNTPEKGRIYLSTADCADEGCDSSTISIIDITEYPHKQVAVFKDSEISHLLFPQMIFTISTKYNEAETLVESNGIGQTILHILNYDLSYENIISTKQGGKLKIGQTTTHHTKINGCMRLREMLENGKLVIQDKETLEEFRHFVSIENSYGAESGFHDDMVMGLVNYAYYVSTNKFRSEHEWNFVDEFREEKESEFLEQLMPLPIFADMCSEGRMSAEENRWLMS